MKTWLTLVAIALTVSGCFGQGSPDDGCGPVFVRGCDHNPDAERMVQEHGLFQMSNTSTEITGLALEDGMAAWMEDDGYHAYHIGKNRAARLAFDTPEWGPNVPFPAKDCVFFTELEDPEGTQFNSTRLRCWRPFAAGPSTDSFQLSDALVSSGGGFDGRRALVQVYNGPGLQYGTATVDTHNKEQRELFRGGPHDQTPYGTPQVGRAIADGLAWLTYLEWDSPDEVASTIIQYDLDDGSEKAVLTVQGMALTRLDAGNRYLTGSDETGHRRILVMALENGTWWEVPQHDAIRSLPATAGDWLLFFESPSNEWRGGLAGIHIPTARWFGLLEDEAAFSISSWDTDGSHVAVKLLLGGDGRFRFPGQQVYWFQLPQA